MLIASNVVPKEKLREVQLETLKLIKQYIASSYGPYASNSIMCKAIGKNSGRVKTQYSKDGFTILKSIAFSAVIEQSVKEDMEDITRHIVKTVGDGTTSAVILSALIFEEMVKLESNTDMSPYEIIETFKKCTERIKKEIKTHVQEFDADVAYRIAMISTNGNEKVAEIVKDIYEKYGNDVFIDVSSSIDTNDYVKEYDGMTLDTGYSDTAYINDSKKGVASIRNAHIYAFSDPIDTVEMMQLMNTIIEKNIMVPYSQVMQGQTEGVEVVPTVILAPTISRDMMSYIEQIAKFLYQCPDENKPPLLIISEFHQQEQFIDISRMCGCNYIKKYINADKQKEDQEAGLAPNVDTVTDFCGYAELVEADAVKTKFINPKEMKDENGEYSDTFNTMVKFLETELKKASEEGQDANVTGTLKRRINSLKANMVEYLVGGVSDTDRESTRDLVEDAVLNCRSAARYGVGYGANFEGLRAASNLANLYSTKHEWDEDKNDEVVNKIKQTKLFYNIIADAYKQLLKTLYKTKYSEAKSDATIQFSLTKEQPINLRNDAFDNSVLCSIETDIVILDAISKIVTVMFTSNQFICPTPFDNQYMTK